MDIIKQRIDLIERIDLLISMKSTGSPEDLAKRLKISKSKLYRIITTMKRLDAPIVYDNILQSFVYEEPVRFKYGFYKKK